MRMGSRVAHAEMGFSPWKAQCSSQVIHYNA
jgi:hypothetical protein